MVDGYQVFIQFIAFYGSSSQELATHPYPEWTESTPIYFCKIYFNNLQMKYI
jgi:hypothetical protein